MTVRPQPWNPADATTIIRAIAKSEGMTLIPTRHALEQTEARELTTGDILYVLKNGFVYNEPEQSTQPSLYKYQVESKSPNSGSRTIRIIAIPSAERCSIKLVTVMWVSE